MPSRLLEPRDGGAHLDAELRVEVRQGLVHEEGRRLADDRAAHGDALALAAGEVAGLAVEVLLEVEDPGGLVDAAVDLLLAAAAELEREADVLPHGHVRVERVALEDHGDVAVARGEVVDDLLADAQLAVGDLLEPGDHPQGRGLPAARGPDQDQELAVLHLEVEALDRLGPVRVPLGHAVEDDVRHGRDHTQPADRCNPREVRARLAERHGPPGVEPVAGHDAVHDVLADDRVGRDDHDREVLPRRRRRRRACARRRRRRC